MSSAKDIAKKLGISTTAVSMVFNNKPGISDETRKRVLETAEAIGYRIKNRTERKKSTIQLLIFSHEGGITYNDNPFFSRIIEGVSNRAQELDYNLLVSHLRGNDIKGSAASSFIHADSGGVILLATDFNSADFSFLKSFSVPLVILDNSFEQYSLDSVSINNLQGIYLAAEHLISLGHRNIYYLGSDYAANNFDERQLGFIRTVASHPETQRCTGNIIHYNRAAQSIESLRNTIGSLKNFPTAFVCANDWLANDCIGVLKELGYRIPDDISVTGFDNTPICEIMTPKLSTINVPKQRMGSLAVDRLSDMIGGKALEHVKIEIMADLVLRDSTAIPRKNK
jgi:LacI family transcriptional regulator